MIHRPDIHTIYIMYQLEVLDLLERQTHALVPERRKHTFIEYKSNIG
jgi:hypothetical protein